MSAFDKSLDSTMFSGVLELYRAFGLSDADCELWELLHRQTLSRSRAGISFYTSYQTKSDDPATALGNTLATMIALTRVMHTVSPQLSLFMGDDSLLFSEVAVPMAAFSFDMAMRTNFTAKMLRPPLGGFCGGFFVSDGVAWRFMTDPIKRIERLGRQDNPDLDLLADRFVSLGDLVRDYSSVVHNVALSRGLAARYRVRADLSDALVTLFNLGHDFTAYLALFGVRLSEARRIDVLRRAMVRFASR